MKKAAFTMVELIFVIVILGILAAVAVPRLNASRDDAKVAAAVADARTLWNDVHTYYAAGNEFTNKFDFSAITNVPLKFNGAANGPEGDDNYYKIDGKTCFLVATHVANQVVFAYKTDYTDASSACKKAIEKMDFIRGPKEGAQSREEMALKDAATSAKWRSIVLYFDETNKIDF